MPNWCENTVVICPRENDSKSAEKYQQFLDWYNSKRSQSRCDTVLSFQWFIPLPTKRERGEEIVAQAREKFSQASTPVEMLDAIVDLQQPLPEFDWYHWNIENWNTKWDACESHIEISTNSRAPRVMFRFDTAWAPPIPIFRKLIADWPELEIRGEYREEGMGFGGSFACDDAGKMMLDEYDLEPPEEEDDQEYGPDDNA